MKNPNALVSLAYIKTKSNPLAIFCNYILYLLLIAPSQSLRPDELSQGLEEKFGLNMPQHIIDNCIHVLKKSGEVVILPRGEGYSVGTTEFDSDAFEKSLERLHEHEVTVLKSIVEFVATNYQITWSVEEAKNYLSTFLDEEGNGAQLFLRDPIQDDSKRVSPSWYIARYVSNVQEKEGSLEKEYLEDIVNGMMIYQGVYQTNDYRQHEHQKFKGTIFYLDTKLILRALGYSWSAQVQSTKELIELITKKYEGKLGVFQQTVDEVQNALYTAGDDFEHHRPIKDDELRIFAELDPVSTSILKELSHSVPRLLKNELNIDPPESFDWDAPIVRAHSINETEVINFIQSEHDWRPGTIRNDVEIINQINILRKGDYSVRYGGKAKLPVFLTTNTSLVSTFRKYVLQTGKSDTVAKWNASALPVITDNMLLFRLWVPYAHEYSNLPSLTLSRYAYAAQNPNTQFFEKLRATAISLKTAKNIDATHLLEEQRRQLEDIVVAKTGGDSDEVTEEMVASSVEELVKMRNLSLYSTIDTLTEKLNNLEESANARDAKKRFSNYRGCRRTTQQ